MTSDPDSVLQENIRELSYITTHTANALNHDGIFTIGDLTRCTELHLVMIHGFGRKSMNEVKEGLLEKGLHLSHD